MSVADKLTRLNTTKQDIKDAIEAKGRDLTGKTFENDYAAEIALIESGEALEITGQEIQSVEFAENITALDTVQIGPFGSIENRDIRHRLNNNNIDIPIPGTIANALTFSPNDEYFTVGHSISPFITIYKRNGVMFNKLPNPGSIPPNTVFVNAFSPDNTYLVTGHADAPFITIYKRSGDTFTKLSDPDILPTGTAVSVEFSPDGTYLAVAHLTSRFVTIYKRDGDTFTKLPDPDVLPTGNGNGISFSPDGTYLAVAHTNIPRITIYKRDGDTFTKLLDPSPLPIDTGRKVSFSPNNTYLALGINRSSSNIVIYKFDNDIFTPLPNVLGGWPNGAIQAIVFSPDTDYLVASGTSAPAIFYKRTGDSFSRIEPIKFLNFASSPGTNSLSFNPNGIYFASSSGTISPFINIYKTDSNQGALKANNKTETIFDWRENDRLITYGYAKESGTTGETKEVVALFKPEVT